MLAARSYDDSLVEQLREDLVARSADIATLTEALSTVDSLKKEIESLEFGAEQDRKHAASEVEALHTTIAELNANVGAAEAKDIVEGSETQDLIQ